MGTMLRLLGIFAAIFAIVAACSILNDTDSSDDAPEPDREDGIAAEVMCEEFVKDRLKAPATAEFSEQTHESVGEQRWQVTGAVDAENGFGAMLRMTYECDLRYLGDDEWRAKTVKVN